MSIDGHTGRSTRRLWSFLPPGGCLVPLMPSAATGVSVQWDSRPLVMRGGGRLLDNLLHRGQRVIDVYGLGYGSQLGRS